MGLSFALLLCLLASEERLEPTTTRAVIVGVLEWPSGLTSYPKRHRKDQELHDVLVARGVPAANIALLLDERATLPNVRESLTHAAGAAEPGSTLIVYYAGHGMPNGSDYCFANHELELERLSETGWGLRELGETLAHEFKGRRVLLFADCCYSGGLERVVERLAAAGISAASVTSASSANTSTDNWTFTQSLIDGLRGEPLVDADGNGSITLAELDGEVKAAMQHLEGQLHGFSSSGVAADFVLAPAAGARPVLERPRFPLGSYVLASERGQKRTGRVVGQRGDLCTVQFYDYSDKRTIACKSVELELSTRAPDAPPPVLDAGVDPDCEVEWQGSWWPARMLEKKDGRFHVHYLGYEARWDEWIGAERVRFPTPKGAQR